MKLRERTLYPSKTQHFRFLLLTLAFVAAGIWIGVRGDWVGYAFAAFFGLGIPVFTIEMLPGASFLRLSNEEFEFSSLYRRHVVRWIDVGEFGVITQKQMGAKVHQTVAGMDAGLPDSYGLSIEDLLDLMQEYWRERIGAELAVPPKSDRAGG